jgi:hypothetical protein
MKNHPSPSADDDAPGSASRANSRKYSQAKNQPAQDPSAPIQFPAVVLKLTGPQLPVDAEFTPHDFDAVFSSCGLRFGQCYGSKSGYRASHPKCVFVPNANVFSIQHGKLWWGDLDIAKNGPALEQVAHRIQCRLFVVREHDGRRMEASLQPQEIQSCAVWCTGGRRKIPNLRKHLSRSGLTKLQLASVLKVSPRTLRRRHDPKTALELNRRLDYAAAGSEEMAADHGYAKWGHWWVKPHRFLGGDTPLAVRRSAPEVYRELFRQETKATLARWAEAPGDDVQSALDEDRGTR